MKIAVLSHKDVAGYYAATLRSGGTKSPSAAVARFMRPGSSILGVRRRFVAWDEPVSDPDVIRDLRGAFALVAFQKRGSLFSVTNCKDGQQSHEGG